MAERALYTLNIVVNKNDVIPFAKGSLESIDKVTTSFKNVNELLDIIEYVFKTKIDGHNPRFSITYMKNKRPENVKVLYAKDKNVLNHEAFQDELEAYILNKDFVTKFVLRYKNSPYIYNLAMRVIDDIRSEENAIRNNVRYRDEHYTIPLERILELVFDSHKTTRDAYLFLKDYEANLNKEEKQFEKTEPAKSDKSKLISALELLKIIYTTYHQVNMFDKINEEPAKIQAETDDPYLQELIAKGDYDTISRYYDHDVLKTKITNNVPIFDGMTNPNDIQKRK